MFVNERGILKIGKTTNPSVLLIKLENNGKRQLYSTAVVLTKSWSY
jgi:hypothetical protein